MAKYLFVVGLFVAFNVVTSNASATVSAGAASQLYVTGVVEHVEAMENEAMVKLVGLPKLLIIKNLMSFPEAKLHLLTESQESRVPLKLKINGNNQILDVINQ